MRLTMLFAGPFEDDIDWKLISGDPDRRPGVERLARPGVRAPSTTRSTARCRGRAIAPAAHAPDDRGRHRGPRALPVQRRDLEAPGADQRAPRRRSTRAGADVRRPRRSRRCWRRSRPSRPRSCGARCSGTPRACTDRPGPAFDPELAREQRVTLVVQVDGKVRDRIEVDPDVDRGPVPRARGGLREGRRGDRGAGDPPGRSSGRRAS